VRGGVEKVFTLNSNHFQTIAPKKHQFTNFFALRLTPRAKSSRAEALESRKSSGKKPV
jgi:hypothetical protein